MTESEEYEIRYQLSAKDGEGTVEAARRVERELGAARSELASIWAMVGSPRAEGALSAIRKLVVDREGDEARKALALILDELGQSPGDHLGALRALRAREGAGGKIGEVRRALRLFMDGKADVGALQAFVTAIERIVMPC